VRMSKITMSLAFCCLIMSAAQGQMTLDISKITCKQFRGYEIADPTNIALWLSGYYNGQRGNTIINVQSFKENVDKVMDYCITSPTTPVMQAVEAVLSKSN
jgi:acid stress chaperone HdeB